MSKPPETEPTQEAIDCAENAYSSGNLVTNDGYYEVDLDIVAAIIQAALDTREAETEARIVAWLLDKAYSFRTPNAGLAMDAAYRAWRDAAEAIERGEHKEPKQ